MEVMKNFLIYKDMICDHNHMYLLLNVSIWAI